MVGEKVRRERRWTSAGATFARELGTVEQETETAIVGSMSTPYSGIVRRLIIASLLCIACSGCRSPRHPDTMQEVFHDGAVTVTDVHFHSSSVEGMFWYRIIGPQVGPNERLPVLYLLHGIDSDPREVMERSSVLKLAIASHLIIVMPEAGFSYYTNAKHKRHARWENAVAEELPRDVEKRFPVLSGREHTGIAGISMGGYGAVKLALKHPALYGFVGNMSGPLDITRREASLRRWGQTLRIWNTFGVRPNIRRDEDVFDLLDRAVEVKSVTWFESCGKNDALLGVNERFARELRERGVSLDLITTSGGHDWQSWNAAMPDLFRIAEKALR